MQAVVVRAPGDYGVESVPVPVPEEGGFLLEVTACGLCGSDLRTLRSGHHRVTLPWIIGHEICGIFREAGPGYGGPWREGDVLAVGPVVYCGTCDFCTSGKLEFCQYYEEIGQKWPGGLADYLAVPPESVRLGNVRPVPEGVDPAAAAIIEPISSCVHAQEKGGVGLGETVVVMGCGPVGCIHLCLARARGASRIFAADIRPERLAFAGRFEPDAVINAAETDLVAAVRDLTGGLGADVVITATPAPAAPVQAVEMARKGGRILLFGGLPAGEQTPPVDMNLIHYNGLYLIGTTTFAPRHNKAAMELVATGRIPAGTLITHRLPLSAFEAGARLALEGTVLKAVFYPGGPPPGSGA
jgi:L-iditol 2-dehydrogenase